jgi:hypothetical protein
MLMIWILGNEFVEKENVELRDFFCLSGLGILAGSIGQQRPLIGASSLVMGLLGGLAVIDPSKTWLMILPIPGVPITNLQLAQATVASHIVAMYIAKAKTIVPKYALTSHVSGLTMGTVYAISVWGWPIGSIWDDSVTQWNRSLSSAWLAIYWLTLSARIPFTSDVERGELITKKRFIQRVWREEF